MRDLAAYIGHGVLFTASGTGGSFGTVFLAGRVTIGGVFDKLVTFRACANEGFIGKCAANRARLIVNRAVFAVTFCHKSQFVNNIFKGVSCFFGFFAAFASVPVSIPVVSPAGFIVVLPELFHGHDLGGIAEPAGVSLLAVCGMGGLLDDETLFPSVLHELVNVTTLVETFSHVVDTVDAHEWTPCVLVSIGRSILHIDIAIRFGNLTVFQIESTGFCCCDKFFVSTGSESKCRVFKDFHTNFAGT